MEIDPRQAAAFVAVVETGSFEQAAVRLHVTASAITQRVRALEADLGTPLVLRTRPCRATATGQRVLQHLRRVSMLQADLQAELDAARQSPVSVVVALNSDSLGTWFLPALSSILSGERLLFELILEDQDHTFGLLESGMAIGCVTTVQKPMRGCAATPLGTMRYRLIAAQAFAARWFPRGLNRAGARQAPVVAYSRRDTLQSSFLLENFGLPEGAYPCHYVRGRIRISRRFSMGLVMRWCRNCCSVKRRLLSKGSLIFAPAHPTDSALYWHAWKVPSPSMQSLSARVVEAARGLRAAVG